MDLRIEKDACRLMINVLLSCRCPVSEDTEHKLVAFYKQTSEQENLPYQDLLTIAGNDGSNTPFHRLRDFCCMAIESPLSAYTISVNDILRHFSTAFHWNVVEKPLSNSYKNLTNLSSWFIGHMLLPVKLAENNGKVKGLFRNQAGEIILHNLFLPPDIALNGSTSYCVHFASVITALSRQQSELISFHLEQIPQLQLMREKVSEIDYCRFQRLGDYRQLCQKRYMKHFGS